MSSMTERGAPDWSAEVLSPSTATYDRVAAGRYRPPVVLELKGQPAISAVPGVSTDWYHLPAA
jgi:hypothetical protein